MKSFSNLLKSNKFIFALLIPLILWLLTAVFMSGEFRKSEIADARLNANSRFFRSGTIGSKVPNLRVDLWNSVRTQALISSLGLAAIGAGLALRKNHKQWGTRLTSRIELASDSIYRTVSIYALTLGLVCLIAGTGYFLYSKISIMQAMKDDRDFRTASTVTIERQDSLGPYSTSQRLPGNYSRAFEAKQNWRRHESLTYWAMTVGTLVTALGAFGTFATRRKRRHTYTK